MRSTVLFIPLLLFCTGATAQNVPQLELVPWALGLDTITDITHSGADDTRLFVVRKQGIINIVSDSMTVVLRPFLNIADQVQTTGHEQGLLGLVFDPDYATNGYFYVNYITGSGSGSSVISRWQVSNDPDSADTASEEIIYTYPQPYTNHNGGDLAFGPDGMLYIPLGDGGDAGDPQGHAQNLSDPLGDILRLDVSDPDTTYTVPNDNPFLNNGDTLPEIWASGLRNPWRISFDRLEGDMWLADVGQSNWEEIDYVEMGAEGGLNFGWRCYEGTAPFNTIDCDADTTYDMPVTVHINDGNFGEWCAIIGGYVYRGTQFPHLQGRYIYTDYCKPQFWSLRETEEGEFIDEMLLEDTSLTKWTVIGENAAGELFVGNEYPGNVYKITDKCPMDPPDLNYDGSLLTTSSLTDSTYMWFLDGLQIPDADASTLVPTQNGHYHVVVVYTNGCMLSSDTVEVVITGFGDLGIPTLAMQPNPASNEVTLVWSMSNVVEVMRLIDAQGREVHAERNLTSTRTTVDLSDLDAGNYSVQLLSRDGLVLAVQKLVVTH